MAVDSRLIERDEFTGVETWFHYDEADDSILLETKSADLTPLLERNKALLNDAGSGWKGDMHHVATLPLTLVHELQRKGILDDAKAFKKWLADPDNRFFRTKAGAL